MLLMCKKRRFHNSYHFRWCDDALRVTFDFLSQLRTRGCFIDYFTNKMESQATSFRFDCMRCHLMVWQQHVIWIIIVVMVKVYLGRIWQICQITNRWRGGSCEILRQCRRRKGLLFSRSPWRQMDRLNIEGVTVPKEQEETRAGRRESRRQIATLTVDRREKLAIVSVCWVWRWRSWPSALMCWRPSLCFHRPTDRKSRNKRFIFFLNTNPRPPTHSQSKKNNRASASMWEMCRIGLRLQPAIVVNWTPIVWLGKSLLLLLLVSCVNGMEMDGAFTRFTGHTAYLNSIWRSIRNRLAFFGQLDPVFTFCCCCWLGVLLTTHWPTFPFHLSL